MVSKLDFSNYSELIRMAGIREKILNLAWTQLYRGPKGLRTDISSLKGFRVLDMELAKNLLL